MIPASAGGAAPYWCIDDHVLAEELDTFSLAFASAKTVLPDYWEFIRCYMEEVSKQKESYITG